MALKTKTVEFSTSVNTSNLAVTVQRLQSITVYIPESSITFRSVTMRAFLRDNTTTNASVTTPAMSIKLGAAGASSANASNPPANTGEAQHFVFDRDVTSYFTTNWTGTSMTTELGITLATMASANHWFKLIITYQYEDTSATQIKTVRIPIESTRQYATTSFLTLGGATAIPALTGGWLPENTPVIRQINIELWGNEGLVTAVTDHTLSIRVNGGTTRAVYFGEQGYTGNALHFWTNYDATAETTYGSARSIELTTDLNNTFAGVGGMIVVTYEFTLSSTTTVMNSIMIGAIDTTGQIQGTAAGDQESWQRSIIIEEPATIALQQSGVCLFLQSAAPAAGTLNVSVGAQSNTAYSMAGNSSFELGPHSLVHRIDSGGTAGTAFTTLTRGRNNYELKIYASANNVWWNLCGFLILNYTSGVASTGIGSHTHSVFNLIKPSNSTSSQNQTGTGAMAQISTTEDDNYYVIGAMMETMLHGGSAVTLLAMSLNAEKGSGEGSGSGWETLFSGQATVDNEKQCTIRLYSASRTSVRRFPSDPDTDRLNPLASRSWRLDLNPAGYSSYGSWLTYHTVLFTVSGTISGSAGGTVNIELFRSSTGEKLLSTSRSGNGAYSFTWYDNTEDVYVVAKETASLKGVSKDDVPNTDFDINLAGGGGSFEYGYGFS
jgi:hypothetical protein